VAAAEVISTPDDSRSPVASIEWLVVLNRRGDPANIRVGLERLGASQETIADLHRPVSVRGVESRAEREFHLPASKL